MLHKFHLRFIWIEKNQYNLLTAFHPFQTIIRSKPLQIWDKTVRNGHIKRITDNDIQSSVLEIIGTNVSTTYISCPAQQNRTLGIKLPFLVMIIKNLKKYFTFEVQVLDDKNVRRRFRASNYQVYFQPFFTIWFNDAVLSLISGAIPNPSVDDPRQALYLHDAHAP